MFQRRGERRQQVVRKRVEEQPVHQVDMCRGCLDDGGVSPLGEDDMLVRPSSALGLRSVRPRSSMRRN